MADDESFPNYMQKPVKINQAKENLKNDISEVEAKEQAKISMQSHRAVEEPTLSRYMSDEKFRGSFEREFKHRPLGGATRVPFQPTHVPKPRSGAQTVPVDDTDYQPIIEKLIRAADQLILFASNKETTGKDTTTKDSSGHLTKKPVNSESVNSEPVKKSVSTAKKSEKPQTKTQETTEGDLFQLGKQKNGIAQPTDRKKGESTNE
ncbi:hypothetical protein [Bavariicoccus seileri]|uniref:hypothetical protein n=1 Tax=Bavariicoccus seileri TaxID=549685 RepID=UPI0003B626FE|nr:hypothetical protein [Bavariicoccus seileri]